jgi:hypothetical protein
MVTMANRVNAKNWREAAKEATRSRDIYAALKLVIDSPNIGSVIREAIHSNSYYIKTMPSQAALKATRFISERTIQGMRSKDIAKELKEQIAQHTRASAELIARTESSKTMTALTQARSQDMGMNWYIWRTANDGNRVRKSHQLMKDVLCNYNYPPSPEEMVGEKSAGEYNAGNIYNCRCYPRPLISTRNIQWPAKVHWNGVIKTMTLLEFQKVANFKFIEQEKTIGKPMKQGPKQQNVYQLGRDMWEEPHWYDKAFGNANEHSIAKMIRDAAKSSAGSGERDEIQAAIFKHQKFDGLPHLLEAHEMDLMAKEFIPVFRGIGGDTAARYVSEFKLGEFYPGKGIYGNGTYTATEYGTAKSYADFQEDNIMHMGIRKDSNIITHEDILAKQRVERRKLHNKTNMTQRDSNLAAIIEDEGKYATLLGYDAIHVEDEGYYVVLNRTALYVRK